MDEMTRGAATALNLVVTGDRELLEIVLRSLGVSVLAVTFAGLIGLPLGTLLAVTRFPGRKVLIVVINALMGLPPVVVGLVIYLLLSRSGPLGALGLLFTPTAMVIAQTVLVVPIICALTRQTMEELWREYAEQMRSFDVGWPTALRTLLWEGRFSLMTALLAGFGRAIGEVGAVLIVGGNIAHVTRVMTTTIALETARGNFALALALGMILIAVALSLNTVAYSIKEYAARHAF
jgi:tungstate transport system permease protein